MSSCGGENDIWCTEEQSYLFTKSLRNLHNKDALARELRLLKQQMVGTEKPSSNSGDPILHFVLGFAERPSKETITDHYRHNNAYSDEAAYSRLRVFLNTGATGANHKLNVDFVAADKWMHSIKVRDKRSLLEAERMGYLLRFISGQSAGVICEMAARGNLWDAFVLMSLIYPDHEITKDLRSYVWKQLDLGWIKELISEKSEPVNFENLTKSGLNTMNCYQIVMDDLLDNKEDPFARNCLFAIMRVYLLTAVCESEVEGCSRDLMNEFFNFISSEAVFLQECLPGLQKLYFKQSSVIIRDVIRVVLHLCNVVKSDEVAKYEDDSHGVLGNLVVSWMAKLVLPEGGPLAEIMKGVSEVLRSFIGDVVDSPDRFSKGSSYKVYILVALLVAEVLFKNSLSHNNGILIFDLLANCEFKEQLVNRLLNANITLKPGTSPVEDMVSSLRDCLLRIQSLFSQQSHFKMKSVSDHCVLNTDVESVKCKESCARTAIDDVPSNTRLTTKWEHSHATATQLTSSIKEKEIPKKTIVLMQADSSQFKLRRQSGWGLDNGDSVKKSTFSVASRKVDVESLNVIQQSHFKLAYVPPRVTDVSLSSTRNAEMTAGISRSSTQQVNSQVNMFCSRFSQQTRSGFGSDDDDSVTFGSRLPAENNFGKSGRGGYGGDRGRGGYGGYGYASGRGNGYFGRRGERGG